MTFFFHFLSDEFAWGLGYFNRPDSDLGYIYWENGVKVTFGTTLQNHKPQMPSSGPEFLSKE